ncbi:MAG: GNAT family N-acetyltransferase [Pseudomonadota bacterium]
MKQATILRTDRLTLSPPAARDWPIYEGWHGDDRDDAWAEFTGDIGHWVVLGFGWFLVRAGEKVVGSVGLHFPPAHAEVELAWNTDEDHRGNGYAPEAARAVLSWGQSRLDVPRIVNYIDRDNTASQAVARKLGATNSRSAPSHDADCDIWVHAEGVA